MSTETLLLFIESVLLAATVVLLLFSLKEGRGRRSLLLELGKAVKVLTRHEYFLTVTDAMLEAKTEVAGCLTGRMPGGEDTKRVRDVIDRISKLRENGVSVRYIFPKLQDRLYMGFEYSRAGAEVRFSSRPIVHDIRYIVVDQRQLVIGIPESTGEMEATKKGYRIPSEGLSGILKEHFSACWHQSTGLRDFLNETIKQTGITPKHLARELGLNESEIERMLVKPEVQGAGQ